MSQFGNVLWPVLGGTALMLGIAYGVNTRSYLSDELAAVRALAEAAEGRASAAEDRADALRSERDALAEELDTQATEVAALRAQSEQAAASASGQASAEGADAPAQPAAEEVAVADLGDATRGERVFRQCSGCHEIGSGAEDGIGPHLNGIFDRRAGSVDGFNYSKAMQRAFGDGLVWDLEHLDAYIENPRVLVSGTRMSFRGLEDPQDRADVLAYMRSYTENPQNIPESAPTATPREVELPPDILAIVGDREYGEYLASECLTCHRVDGADEGIPSIVYWPEENFVIAMHAYKQKLRPHPVMQMMASRLSDEEIAALAAYFASIE